MLRDEKKMKRVRGNKVIVVGSHKVSGVPEMRERGRENEEIQAELWGNMI